MSTKLMEFFKRGPAIPAADTSSEVKVKPVVLKPAELLALINEARPRAMKNIPEKQALGIVSAVLSALGTRIDEATDAPVRVAGLGVFRSREIENKGADDLKRVRKTSFRRIPPAARKSSNP